MKYGQPKDKWNRISNQHFIEFIHNPPDKEYGYLTILPKGKTPCMEYVHFTTWTGQILAKGIIINRSIGNFGDDRVYFRVRHPETNRIYSGYGQGDGMLARVKLTKIEDILD